MVARIAPEPVSTQAAVSGSRSRLADARTSDEHAGPALPPVPVPVPTPVPAPAIVPPTQAFAAALIAQHIDVHGPSVDELRLRLPTGWQAPDSPLRLTDRRI